jgi:hypothetical protein
MRTLRKSEERSGQNSPEKIPTVVYVSMLLIWDIYTFYVLTHSRKTSK